MLLIAVCDKSSQLYWSILHNGFMLWVRVSTTPVNLLELKNPPGNPGNLLEFVWSYWKFLCKMSGKRSINFTHCNVRWSSALVSSHDKTGYRIAYLRNCHWSPLFIFATAPCSAYHVFVRYLGKLVDSVHCIAGWSNANMSWIFLEIHPGNLLEMCSVKFVDTVWVNIQYQVVVGEFCGNLFQFKVTCQKCIA